MSASFQLALRGPGGEPVDLWRTLISHGFAELAPMKLDEAERILELTLRPARGRPRRVRVARGRAGHARVDVVGPAPSPAILASLREQVARVLRLDQDLSTFYEAAATDPDLAWAADGAGRMLRSPTVWEDVIKTLCTTNCSWSLTTRMVNALVTELGDPVVGSSPGLTNAFPTPETMARRDESFYRGTVRSGYRAPHFVTLARGVAEGAVELESLGTASREDLPDAEVEARLLALPGIGPYAAAHIMMTLGRNTRLILDSWSRPKYARLIGHAKPPADRTIERRFRRYGPEAGLAFWLFVTRDWAD